MIYSIATPKLGFGARWIALCLIWLMSACTEGYPPSDHVPEEPQRMNTAQRLDALNDLAERNALARQWRYSMPQACVLRVQRRGTKDDADLKWPLENTRFELGRSDNTEVFEVLATRGAAPSTPAKPVLQTSRWFDARFALSLLSHMQQDCAR